MSEGEASTVDGEERSDADVDRARAPKGVDEEDVERGAKLRGAIASRAAWLLPLLTTIIGIVPAVWALRAQTFAIFGRDQGIFQYVAWALRNGERTYKDIHEINGPLPHAWHMMMQVLGGEDEHVFRSIDAIMLVVAYTLAGTTIPRWVGLTLGSRSGANARRRMLVLWALAGLTVLGSQYVRFDWWHTAQREALYSVLILASLAVQSIVHTTTDKRRARLALVFVGIATSLTWFGKPPCAIFAVLQLIVLWVDRKSLAVSFRAAMLPLVVGVLAVGLSMLAFLLAYADIGSGIELLSKVPRLHHTIWNETLLGAYRSYNNAPRLDWALATFVAFLVVYVRLKLPRRALLACVLPVGGMIVFGGQGKAFPYHLHMVTLGTAALQLVILAALAQYVQTIADSPSVTVSKSKTWLIYGAAIGALSLGVKCAQDALLSPGVRGDWSVVGATPEQRTSHAYFDAFPWGDFFANDLRTSAAYLAFHTRPDERIQTYGFDPYLLFLARRKSASPVIYNFELNVDAALEGGPGARPSPELKQWLTSYRDDAERLVLHAVEARPPAAFVLFDRAPWTFPADADRDFEKHCPDLHRFMIERYQPAATFGTVRIWLRRDVMARSLDPAHL